MIKDLIREDGGETATKKCRLNNGLDGFINKKNCSENFFNKLSKNIVVNAKIINIEYD